MKGENDQASRLRAEGWSKTRSTSISEIAEMIAQPFEGNGVKHGPGRYEPYLPAHLQIFR